MKFLSQSEVMVSEGSGQQFFQGVTWGTGGTSRSELPGAPTSPGALPTPCSTLTNYPKSGAASFEERVLLQRLHTSKDNQDLSGLAMLQNKPQLHVSSSKIKILILQCNNFTENSSTSTLKLKIVLKYKDVFLMKFKRQPSFGQNVLSLQLLVN